MKSIDQVIERATATRNAQDTIAKKDGWVWPEKTVVQWDGALTDLDQKLQAESACRARWQIEAARWDVFLQTLADHSRDVARLARTRFRADEVKLRVWQSIKARRNSRAAIYRTAVAVRDAWQATEPKWTPLKDLPLADFSDLLETHPTFQRNASSKESEWRHAAGELSAAARTLDGECVAWYSDATTHFPDTTPLGIMLRSTIPTSSGSVAPPAQAEIKSVRATGATIEVEADAERATRFTYYHLSPGTKEYVAFATDVADRTVTLADQTPGVHWFKAEGRNSGGTGPISAGTLIEIEDPTEVNVTPPRGATPVSTHRGTPVVSP